MEYEEILRTIDRLASKGADVFGPLRDLPVDVVGRFLLGIPGEYPNARVALPAMPSDQVQDSWTGRHGFDLLAQSCAFVRSVESGYLKYVGKPLNDKTILDYGCGWGRLIRLMYKFTAPENIYGCDPWDKSIELCKESNVHAHLSVCDYMPKDAPFPGVRFDLIYAFSVFTHLSEKTSKVVLSACRRSIKDDGLLALTIRPAAYWDAHNPGNQPFDLAQIKADHAVRGFAFAPHVRPPVDGDITYGDASVSMDYIKKNWTDWEIVGFDFNLVDSYQIIVFLKPRNNI